MKINQILIKIDEKQLFVPAFQREYVWRRADAKNLISSLIKDYPTGTMLTWETNHPPEIKGDHKYDPKQGSVKLILDGQEAQKSHGLCKGSAPDIANLPAGEVYFVPVDAVGQFPMKYHDGTLGLLDVKDRNIYRSSLLEGDQVIIKENQEGVTLN